MKELKKNYPLKNVTTIKIGGSARYFFAAKNEAQLIKKICWANKNRLRWRVIGDGSNLIPDDTGFNGLLIKNEIKNFKKIGNKILVGAGNNLLKFIYRVNKNSFLGMEKMAGIPGTIGGAVYGCAGAYGQEIKDCLIKVKIFDGRQSRQLSKKQCCFGYRESIFKKKSRWVILGAEFKFKKDNPKKLEYVSRAIIKLRNQKYRSDFLCPGSFFKNIVIKNIKSKSLREDFLSKIPKNKIVAGKVSAGYLLDMVGAKKMKLGGIGVASHHANLIYNSGNGKSLEIKKLADILKERVKKRFGINLKEEIQYL